MCLLPGDFSSVFVLGPQMVGPPGTPGQPVRRVDVAQLRPGPDPLRSDATATEAVALSPLSFYRRLLQAG